MKQILIFFIITSLFACNYRIVTTEQLNKPCPENENLSPNREYSYPELLEKLAEYEAEHREDFVETKSIYRKQLFNKKLAYTFNVKNTAKVATFKDAKFLVTVISETNTVIKTDTIYVYKFFPPQQTTQYKFVTTEQYQDRVTVDIEYLDVSMVEYKNK
ncbi:MAG: hypothetical protein U9Q83_09045 [Bacteroidota bacterium]|nr:hypothetical protein [Bacteroidota bacterium]